MMNNDYLCRGKRSNVHDPHKGEWVYGAWLPGSSTIIETDNRNYYVHHADTGRLECDCAWVVDPATLGRCTGLKDKNGRLIFEGDIVVQNGYIWFDSGEPNYRGTVEWIYSQWQVVAHCVNAKKRGISDGANEGLNDEGFDYDENSEWEIIGNIHDNPELLGEVGT